MDLEGFWSAMQTETLDGIPLSQIVGGGEPKVVAEMVANSIYSAVGLWPQARILDVGCGCGRVAGALAERFGLNLKYTGIDIVPGLVDFASKHLTLPDVRFYARDQGNPSYDYFIHEGTERIQRIADVVPDGSIDVCIAISLFTHLDGPQSLEVMREIAAALKPGGVVFMTCFYLTGSVLETIRNAVPTRTFTFQHTSPSGQRLTNNPDEPTQAVGLRPQDLVSLAREAGLTVRQVTQGYWSGLKASPFQDEVVLEKPRLPTA